MKVLSKFVFVLVPILCCVTNALGQKWVPFSSAAGQFSSLLPGEPQEGTTPLRDGIATHEVTALSPEIMVRCGWAEMPATPQDLNKHYDAVRDGSIAAVHGSLLSEKAVTVSGYAGRRFRATGVGNVFLDQEIVLVGKRLYMVVISTATKLPNPDIEKVFASFQILPKK